MAQTALRRGTQEDGNSEYFTGCPIGGGFIWYGLPTKIPVNCRICDNSTLAISQFAKLNENIGGSWGTDGTNVNLPDLRGRFPRGVDAGAGNDPGGRTAANAGGNSGDAVGSVQGDAMQGHWHNVTYANGSLSVGSNSGAVYGFPNTVAEGNVTTQAYTATNPVQDYVNGTPRTSSESRPINANVYFVIRVS